LLVDRIIILKWVEAFGDQKPTNGEVWSKLDSHPTYFVNL
jgi:hypothetical protein